MQRVTGQTTAKDLAFAVTLLVPFEALLTENSRPPAEIPGYGPVPLALLTDSAGRKTYRRIITRDGIVIGGDSIQRSFPRCSPT
ncbi:hypothetical protein SAMN05443637_103166 [Pseudonocardia thermophila]|uniref:Uncharacterized protein n=1 Tax=Pseudonocardia thermophila TaxID=1848 RepID=A0A1M6Q919_PSETH|nr:hypothetical protein [Pseudonocardia thermophila]SHK16640.1 hypothetical protein SAMN05443637_103166 [Pseudonocardia thermophila]